MRRSSPPNHPQSLEQSLLLHRVLAGHNGARREAPQLLVELPGLPKAHGKAGTGSNLFGAGFGFGAGAPSSPCLRSAAFASSRCRSATQGSAETAPEGGPEPTMGQTGLWEVQVAARIPAQPPGQRLLSLVWMEGGLLTMYGPFFSTASAALFSLWFSAHISYNIGKDRGLVASLRGDEVTQSHLRASGHSQESPTPQPCTMPGGEGGKGISRSIGEEGILWE